MELNPVTEAFLARLRGQLSGACFRPVEPRYLEEPRGRFHGQAGVVLAPGNVAEVSAIVTEAARARVPVVPYGGGTGLVCGQVMACGPAPVVLSLERMARIRAVHAGENVLIAEAGATLHAVRAAAAEAGRLFPLSLASEGSCQIGGNLATNAGGVNVLRYGNARELCLGLEAVLPDGSVWHGLKRLRKDNTGYDLRNLLIGSEGTLGVITAASLRLFARPESEGAALIVVPTPAAALDLLNLAQRRIGEGISAFELIGGTGLEFLAETMPEIRQPFARPPVWSVLIDLGLSGGADPQEALAALFGEAAEAGLALDGVVAGSEAQRQALWLMRESIPLANRRVGAVASHDVSLPLSAIPEFLERAGREIAARAELRINAFGHLGDGNLHYNLFPAPGARREDHAAQAPGLTRLVHDLVADLGGSFSAEHGVGRLKVEELRRYADPARLAAMRAIKAALDPAGIMNPGAVLG